MSPFSKASIILTIFVLSGIGVAAFALTKMHEKSGTPVPAAPYCGQCVCR